MPETKELRQLARVPDILQQTVDRLTTQTTAELAKTFAQFTVDLVDRVIGMAAIVYLYDQREADTKALSLNGRDLAYLRRIAYGQMLPELMVDEKLCLSAKRAASRLPIPDQRKIVEGKPFAVVTFNEGEWNTERQLRPGEWTPEQARQVISYEGQIRTLAQQRTYIEERQSREARPIRDEGPVLISERERCIYVSGDRVKLTAKQLLEYAAKVSV